MTQPRAAAALQYLRTEIAQDRAALLPLRLFIGVGWLRACLEKALNPEWWNGHALSAWLTHHLTASPYPAYAALMAHGFRPHALQLGLLVMALQLLVGLGIFTGTYTRPALLAGIVLNLNFVAAGAPTPSAFYLVIQLALLTGGAGLVFSLDGLLAGGRSGGRHRAGPFNLPGAALLLLCLLALGGGSLPFARDFSVGGSVSDPAIILAVTAFFGAGCLMIGLLRNMIGSMALTQSPVGSGTLTLQNTRASAPSPLLLQPGAGESAEASAHPEIWPPELAISRSAG